MFFAESHLCGKKNTPPPERTIVDILAEEEEALDGRIQNIKSLLPTLEQEMKNLAVKLDAVQKARFALNEVYRDESGET